MRPIDPANSPCTGVCKIVENACTGCLRTLDQIREYGLNYRRLQKRMMTCPHCRGQTCEVCNYTGKLERK